MKQFYEFIDTTTPFQDQNICSCCNILCSREKGWHWLLNKEADLLSSFFDISYKDGVAFFPGGKCAHLDGNNCSIYSQRPTECRLSPLSLYVVEDRPSWIFDTRCPYFQRYLESIDFQKEVQDFINQLEAVADQSIKAAFLSIAKSVTQNYPSKTYYFIKNIE